jgi:hypothetical protein
MYADLTSTPMDAVALPSDCKEFARAQVDLKHLVKFLACHAVNPRDIVCCTVLSVVVGLTLGVHGDAGLVLHVYLHRGDTQKIGVISYYVPGVLD